MDSCSDVAARATAAHTQEILIELLSAKSTAEELYVDGLALEGISQLVVDDGPVLVLGKAACLLHHSLEHFRE